MAQWLCPKFSRQTKVQVYPFCTRPIRASSILSLVQLLTIIEIKLRVGVNRPIYQLRPYSCKEDLDFFCIPSQDPGEERYRIGFHTLDHINLMVTPEFLQFAVFRPGINRDLCQCQPKSVATTCRCRRRIQHTLWTSCRTFLKPASIIHSLQSWAIFSCFPNRTLAAFNSLAHSTRFGAFSTVLSSQKKSMAKSANST